MNYYNDIDPDACAWLRELIARGMIPQGDVDSRSIADVQPHDLKGYTQCHFFTGIGGWSKALELAGWPPSRPVWTGSCPCQPFSAAGKEEGFEDSRHLWPEWFRLVQQCKPPVIFGEQVARATRRGWLDAVANGLESEGYAIGAAVLPACSVGAPHIRERLWFVAHADGWRTHPQPQRISRGQGQADTGGHGPLWPLADSYRDQRHGRTSALQMGGQCSTEETPANAPAGRTQWPAEPDLPRVAHGILNRLAKLRGLGNAIVPQVAAEFIAAYLEASASSS